MTISFNEWFEINKAKVIKQYLFENMKLIMLYAKQEYDEEVE